MSSSFTQQQIDDFEQSLADRKGATDFTFGDQSVRFASFKEAVEFLSHMKRNLSSNTTPRTRYAAFSKGV